MTPIPTNSSGSGGGTKLAASLLAEMANPSRLAVLRLLCEREHPVAELVPKIGLSQSALSQHLARLRSSGLVRTRREGQSIFYSAACDTVGKVLAALGDVLEGSQTGRSKEGLRP